MTASMETSYTFRNMESAETLREHTSKKLDTLTKYLLKEANAHVIFNVEGSRHIAEITLNSRGVRFVGLDSGDDMYTSVDKAVEKLKKQLLREKEKIKGHKGE